MRQSLVVQRWIRVASLQVVQNLSVLLSVCCYVCLKTGKENA